MNKMIYHQYQIPRDSLDRLTIDVRLCVFLFPAIT
jgi:hypothetical protein